MSTITRRFAIFTLIVAVFAVGFSAIVAHPSRKELRLQSGLAGIHVSCLTEDACSTAVG